MHDHLSKLSPVSKLFRAYGLYNDLDQRLEDIMVVSKLFRAYGLYNQPPTCIQLLTLLEVSKLFRAYGLYNIMDVML